MTVNNVNCLLQAVLQTVLQLLTNLGIVQLSAKEVGVVIRLTERHFLSALAPSATWTKPQSRCRVCSRQRRRRDVKTICDQCLSKPRLCAVPCFGL